MLAFRHVAVTNLNATDAIPRGIELDSHSGG